MEPVTIHPFLNSISQYSDGSPKPLRELLKTHKFSTPSLMKAAEQFCKHVNFIESDLDNQDWINFNWTIYKIYRKEMDNNQNSNFNRINDICGIYNALYEKYINKTSMGFICSAEFISPEERLMIDISYENTFKPFLKIASELQSITSILNRIQKPQSDNLTTHKKCCLLLSKKHSELEYFEVLSRITQKHDSYPKKLLLWLLLYSNFFEEDNDDLIQLLSFIKFNKYIIKGSPLDEESQYFIDMYLYTYRTLRTYEVIQERFISMKDTLEQIYQNYLETTSHFFITEQNFRISELYEHILLMLSIFDSPSSVIIPVWNNGSELQTTSALNELPETAQYFLDTWKTYCPYPEQEQELTAFFDDIKDKYNVSLDYDPVGQKMIEALKTISKLNYAPLQTAISLIDKTLVRLEGLYKNNNDESESTTDSDEPSFSNSEDISKNNSIPSDKEISDYISSYSNQYSQRILRWFEPDFDIQTTIESYQNISQIDQFEIMYKHNFAWKLNSIIIEHGLEGIYPHPNGSEQLQYNLPVKIESLTSDIEPIYGTITMTKGDNDLFYHRYITLCKSNVYLFNPEQFQQLEESLHFPPLLSFQQKLIHNHDTQQAFDGSFINNKLTTTHQTVVDDPKNNLRFTVCLMI